MRGIRNCNQMDRKRRSDKRKIFRLLIYDSRLSYLQIFSSRSLPQRPTQDYYQKIGLPNRKFRFGNSKSKRKSRLGIRCHELYLLIGRRPKSYYKCLSKRQFTNCLHSSPGKWRECSRRFRLCKSCLIQLQISSRSRSRDATDQIVAAISLPLCQQNDRVKDVMHHVAKYARRCGNCLAWSNSEGVHCSAHGASAVCQRRLEHSWQPCRVIGIFPPREVSRFITFSKCKNIDLKFKSIQSLFQ